MTTHPTRNDRGRPPEPVDDLDPETLRLVQSFLDPQADRRGLGLRAFEAWGRFYAACDPLIRRLARRRSGRVFDHEDRVQEIWRIIVAHLGHFDPHRGPFPGWLKSVVRHVLDDQDRSHHPLQRLVIGVEQQLPGREADPADLYESARSRRRVERAIKELRGHVSETSYRIVHDHWVAGRTFAELAVTLGFTVKRVRDRHRRAMGKLRELLLSQG
jgi:RNA polymerase sigma factor (sigma-70 family)